MELYLKERNASILLSISALSSEDDSETNYSEFTAEFSTADIPDDISFSFDIEMKSADGDRRITATVRVSFRRKAPSM